MREISTNWSPVPPTTTLATCTTIHGTIQLNEMPTYTNMCNHDQFIMDLQ